MKPKFIAIFLFSCVAACGSPPEAYDLVLKGGRVIDPETGLDGVRDVGIQGEAIARIWSEPFEGDRPIDVGGLVVAPGFIDLHRHDQTADGYAIMDLGGVTTALELEIGVPELEDFVEVREGKSLINYGATASYLAARVRAWERPIAPSLFGAAAGMPVPASGPVTHDPASPERAEKIRAILREQLEKGALGIGVGLEYSPGASRHEVIEIFRLAEAYHVPVFIHARSAGRIEPGSSIEAIGEVMAAAAISGAAVHIRHINSTCLSESPECLSMIAGALARGLDVTTEAYPYTAGMTVINSALFNPGWREKRGLDYTDIEFPESGERLTRERFDALHSDPQARLVLIHMNPGEVVDAIIVDSLVAIASDRVQAHPRGAGTFSRVLARYVREQNKISLTEGIRKMSLMPALRLAAASAS